MLSDRIYPDALILLMSDCHQNAVLRSGQTYECTKPAAHFLNACRKGQRVIDHLTEHFVRVVHEQGRTRHRLWIIRRVRVPLGSSLARVFDLFAARHRMSPVKLCMLLEPSNSGTALSQTRYSANGPPEWRALTTSSRYGNWFVRRVRP